MRPHDDHDHQRRTSAEAEHVAAAEPVLDIGGDIGALVLRTGPEYLDCEIEVSPVDDDAARVHTAIHRRSIGDRVLFAGVYPELRAGDYRVWADDPRLLDRVTIVGGAVAELDWTAEADEPVETDQATEPVEADQADAGD